MRRVAWLLAALVLLGCAAVELGAVLEAGGVNGGFGCERAIDNEGSAFQGGVATPRLWPPAVRCTYEATRYGEHVVPAAAIDRFPWVGSFFLGAGLVAVGALVGVLVASFHWVNRARAEST